MSERIEVGDLVMVVRGHSCTVNRVGGMAFTVSGIGGPWNGGWMCDDCGQLAVSTEDAATNSKGWHIPLSWLKKIPPLKEPERIAEKETA